jgi:RNA polymerase sigma factor (sigma-70 family)
MTKDYLIEVKVKNNLLHKAMLEEGINTVAELSRLSAVSDSTIGRYLNLTVSPINKKTGAWHKNYVKVCSFLRRLPEDLYPAQHINAPLKKNKSQFEESFEDLSSYLLPKNPDENIKIADMRKMINHAARKLTPRESDIIKKRFGLDDFETHTYEQIAQQYGLSRETIKISEAHALRKLRFYNRNKKLRNFI